MLRLAVFCLLLLSACYALNAPGIQEAIECINEMQNLENAVLAVKQASDLRDSDLTLSNLKELRHVVKRFNRACEYGGDAFRANIYSFTPNDDLMTCDEYVELVGSFLLSNEGISYRKANVYVLTAGHMIAMAYQLQYTCEKESRVQQEYFNGEETVSYVNGEALEHYNGEEASDDDVFYVYE
jgi:hypothetical protein